MDNFQWSGAMSGSLVHNPVLLPCNAWLTYRVRDRVIINVEASDNLTTQEMLE